MARVKTIVVSDEQIVAALISTGKVTAAAKVCGISARTIYDRMHTYEFAELYAEAKTDILRITENKLTGHLGAAVDTIAEVMTDTKNNAAVRMQAAQAIISNAVKMVDCLKAGELRAREAANKNGGDFYYMKLREPPEIVAEATPAAELDEITGSIFGSE